MTSEAWLGLLQEDEVEEGEEGMQADEVPQLEKDIAAGCKARLIGSVYGVVVVVVESSGKGKLPSLNAFEDHNDDLIGDMVPMMKKEVTR